jgi:hypothetical protein
LIHTYNLSASIQCLDWNDENILAIALDDKPVRLFNIKTVSFVNLKKQPGRERLPGIVMENYLPLETMKVLFRSGIKKGNFLDP